MLGPIADRRSVTLYLCCHPVRVDGGAHESETSRGPKEKKRGGTLSGARRGLVCKHRGLYASRSLLMPRNQQWKILSDLSTIPTCRAHSGSALRTVMVKPSNRIRKKAVQRILYGVKAQATRCSLVNG